MLYINLSINAPKGNNTRTITKYNTDNILPIVK
jgi:hypothetical protein